MNRASAPFGTFQIVIESLDPPCGQGVLDGHEPWAFCGWLELIETVERIKEGDTGRESSPRSGPLP